MNYKTYTGAPSYFQVAEGARARLMLFWCGPIGTPAAGVRVCVFVCRERYTSKHYVFVPPSRYEW